MVTAKDLGYYVGALVKRASGPAKGGLQLHDAVRRGLDLHQASEESGVHPHHMWTALGVVKPDIKRVVARSPSLYIPALTAAATGRIPEKYQTQASNFLERDPVGRKLGTNTVSNIVAMSQKDPDKFKDLTYTVGREFVQNRKQYK